MPSPFPGPLLQIKNVTKRFGELVAVDKVNLTVEGGEFVTIIGPNGAGKTTTMRMLTGYYPMTSGKIEIAGYDISEHPQEVRRRIGYLPESCPLYPEMRVNEYLS